MAKDIYSACATRPEEVVICTALNAGDYPQLYSERVQSILETIEDEGLREKVKQTLGSFEGRDGRLAQSSPYRLVVLNEILPKGKVLVARPRLQVAKEGNPDFLSGFYVDCGLNLVGEAGYKVNQVQAEELAKDLRQVGINLTNPKLTPYSILTCGVDGNSPSGLVFKLSEQGKGNAKSLILNTRDFNWDYFPTNNGLFRTCLYSYGGWGADDGNLQYSYDGGRVVVETTGEASALEFQTLKQESEQFLVRQQKERQDLIARLQA
jgi:hypothetical protein